MAGTKQTRKLGFFDRVVFNLLLLAEQIIGKRCFARVFSRRKRQFLNRLNSRLSAGRSDELKQIDRRFDLTPEAFQNEYFRAGKPVIFSGAAKDWNCCQKWNLDYFSVGYGENDLLLVDAQGLTHRDSRNDFELLTLRELVDNIKAGGEKYLRFSPLLKNNPDLAEDLDLQWLRTMQGKGGFANTYYMFMGGRGQKTLLHNDQPCNLFVQIQGEKKWTLYSPKDTAFLYPELTNSPYVKTALDVSQPDEAKFPLYKNATPFEAHLKAGDVLYVPPFYWHQVENLTDTIAVGYRYSSLKAALNASITFTLVRLFSTNPPIWKTMEYGKVDTNLIWAHANGRVKEVMAQWESRKKMGFSHER